MTHDDLTLPLNHCVHVSFFVPFAINASLGLSFHAETNVSLATRFATCEANTLNIKEVI